MQKYQKTLTLLNSLISRLEANTGNEKLIVSPSKKASEEKSAQKVEVPIVKEEPKIGKNENELEKKEEIEQKEVKQEKKPKKEEEIKK